MPVVQLQNDTGANIGTALGAVGGYLATKKQRDADKAAATARQTATDARTDRAAQDTHDKITSDIAAQQATSSRDTTTEANTQFQTGAYGKLSTMLHNRPKGVTAQQWVAQVQSQVPTLGLTDPKLLGQLYGEAQGIVKDDQTQNAASFAGHEQTLPTDPKQRLSVLMKRLQAERGVTGLDTKPTQDMITDTQKQITDGEKGQITPYQQQELAIRMAALNKPRASGGGGRGPDGLTPYEELENRRWTQTHNPDGSPRAPSRADTSGLNNAGKEAYGRDMTIWTTQGMQGDPPDPSDPKYSKRSAAPVSVAPNTAPAAKTVLETRVINGVPWHKYSDGTFGR